MKEIIGFALGTAVLALLFWLMEALWPEDRTQPKWRRDSLTDLTYWFFDNYVTRILAGIVVVVAIGVTARFVPRLSVGMVAAQPGWLQVLEILLLGDLIGYWVHRAFHSWSGLWPFHAVHHSPTKLDWLAAARLHPINSFADKVAVILPFYFLGFSGNVLAAYAPFLAIYPIVLHANVRWNFGPFRYLLASPAFHRWHHSSDLQALNKNFSGLFPFVDVIFGTAYFPRYGHPQRYGLHNEQMPAGILPQLAYPFKRKQPDLDEFGFKHT